PESILALPAAMTSPETEGSDGVGGPETKDFSVDDGEVGLPGEAGAVLAGSLPGVVVTSVLAEPGRLIWPVCLGVALATVLVSTGFAGACADVCCCAAGEEDKFLDLSASALVLLPL